MATSSQCDSAFASPKSQRAASISGERRPLAPVTPQRANRALHARAVSSPLTPSSFGVVSSSPFTPITNYYSSSPSLVSPNSSVSTNTEFSPDSTRSKSRSAADVAPNWRLRRKENDLAVNTDELSLADAMQSPGATIPASFLSTHRRSRQAMFQASSTDSSAFISPKTARMPVVDGNFVAPILPMSSANFLAFSSPESVRTFSGSYTLSTPSPRTSLAIVQKLRQRGSLTDPARPRRRRISGPISGETLFDIDEDVPVESPYSRTSTAFSKAFDDDNFFPKRCVSAPFIAERFYDGCVDDDDDESFEDDGLPSAPELSRLRLDTSVSSTSPTPLTRSHHHNATENLEQKVCSVCSSSASALSILVPCEHLICSSCLTGALNIIGEKDMRCAACDRPVDDFKLLSPLKKGILSGDAVNNTKEYDEVQPIDLLPSAFDETSNKTFESTRSKVRFESPAGSVANSDCLYGENDNWAVLRIDNVPWDVTPFSLVEFFKPYTIVRAHVLLDMRGKTLSHAYVEVATTEARNALRSVQNKSLGKGKRLRGVTVTMSSQSELMRALFPSWLGGFDGARPTLDGLDQPAVVRTLENGLLTMAEIDSLVALMKNPKSHFLKVPTLPFHSLISILWKFPTDLDSCVFWSSKLRDVLYDLTNAACDFLIERIQTSLHDQSLLEDFVAILVNCQVFTDSQRLGFYETMIDRISAKGCNIRCPPPAICSPHVSISSTVRPDNLASSQDSDSPISTTSGRSTKDQRQLGYGRPSSMRKTENKMATPPAATYSAMSPVMSPTGGIAAIPASQFKGPAALGPGNLGIGYSLPFTINTIPPQSHYDVVAQEFGVEPHLVAALAQRLSFSNQPAVAPQLMRSFAFANGRL